MTAPARVLWLIKGLGPGGAERLLVDTARSIDRRRFDVSAAYLLPWKDHLVGELRDAGVVATCLGARGDVDPRWIVRLRAIVRTRRIQLVHAHSPVAAALARLTVGGRTAIVTTEHNTWDRYHPATRRLSAATFGRQQAAIAVSKEVARSIGPRARPALHVIPNGIDADAVRAGALRPEAARAELGVPPGIPIVGTIGGITAKKGHVHLVHAMSRLIERVPDVRLVIVGLPIDPEPVRRAIAEARLEGRVVLAGYHAAAARLMTAFDVFALPSLHEGLPVSLLEAMALGVPVVASRVGGVPEVVTDGADGVLVTPGDEAALATALADLLVDAGRRRELAAAARTTAGRFSLAAAVRRTEDVYDEALAVRRRR